MARPRKPRNAEGVIIQEEEKVSDYEEGTDDEGAKPKKRKARKKPTGRRQVKNVKGKKGALAKALDLPQEVFHLIFEQVDHRDLWVLSQVNRLFRDILTSTGAKKMWQDAEDRIGVPELAVPMSHTQLAHLAYSKECYECGHFPVHTRMWDQRTVLCKPCVKEHTLKANKISTLEGPLHPLLRYALSEAGEFYWSSDLLILKEHALQINQVLLREFPAPDPAPNWDSDRLDWLWRDSPTPRYDPLTYISYPFVGPVNRLGAHIKQIQNRRAGLRSDGRALEKWSKELKTMRRVDLDQVRDQRRKDIQDRLLQLGWTEADFDDKWRRDAPRPVTLATPLTDRTFENMLPALNEFVAKSRAERAEREKLAAEKALRTRVDEEIFVPLLSAQAVDGFKITRNIFLCFENVRTLWKGKTEMDDEAFERVKATALEDCRTFVRTIKKTLIESVHDAFAVAQQCQPELTLKPVRTTVSGDEQQAWRDVANLRNLSVGVDVTEEVYGERGSAYFLDRDGPSLSRAINMLQSSQIFMDEHCFGRFDKRYGDLVSNPSEFIDAVIPVRPRHFLVRHAVYEAVSKDAHVDPNMAMTDLDGTWQCLDCSVPVTSRVLSEHCVKKHFYASMTGDDEGPPRWEQPDNLDYLRSAKIPNLKFTRYTPQAFNPIGFFLDLFDEGYSDYDSEEEYW